MPMSEQAEVLADARQLAESGDFEKASKIAFSVLERAPNSPMALHMIGYIYLMVDKPVLAYQFYRRALQADAQWLFEPARDAGSGRRETATVVGLRTEFAF